MSLLRLSLGILLGIQIWILLAFGAAGLGAPWTPLTVTVLALLAGALAAGASRALRGMDPAPWAGETSARFVLAARLLLLGALAVFLWKLVQVPLWSWDHFAMWGVKARRLLDGEGYLSLGFLREPSFRFSRPDYPLALPALWRLAAVGGEPGVALFKGVHALLALALAAVVAGGVRRLGAAPGTGELLAAWAAASPLFWDTVNLGLADLPLALWATAALVLILLARDLPPSAAQAAGFLTGFLPWIKDEGLPLAGLLLAVFAGQRAGWKRFAACAAWACGLAGAGRLFAHAALPSGTGFFAGDWLERGGRRLGELGPVLREIGRVLADPAWLGFWVVLGAVLAAAVLGSRWRGLGAIGAVVLQLALYAGVVLVAVPEPVDHVRASAVRFAGALLPLGMIGIGVWWSDKSSSFRSD